MGETGGERSLASPHLTKLQRLERSRQPPRPGRVRKHVAGSERLAVAASVGAIRKRRRLTAVALARPRAQLCFAVPVLDSAASNGLPAPALQAILHGPGRPRDARAADRTRSELSTNWATTAARVLAKSSAFGETDGAEVGELRHRRRRRARTGEQPALERSGGTQPGEQPDRRSRLPPVAGIGRTGGRCGGCRRRASAFRPGCATS